MAELSKPHTKSKGILVNFLLLHRGQAKAIFSGWLDPPLDIGIL